MSHRVVSTLAAVQMTVLWTTKSTEKMRMTLCLSIVPHVISLPLSRPRSSFVERLPGCLRLVHLEKISLLT